jgi:hypothetical protein
MQFSVKCGEIDRDNNPVGEPRTLAGFDDKLKAEEHIEREIARFDHKGAVPDGPRAGWWGRNDRDRFEKFHFWIEDSDEAGAPDPVRNKQYRGLP